MWLKGKLCGKGTRKAFADGAIEVYDASRYFTVTGSCLNSNSIAERQTELDTLYSSLGVQEDKPTVERGSGFLSDDTELNEIDKEVISIGKCDRVFELLYLGKWQGSYPSQSEADAALCAKLAFYCGGNEDAINRIFRSSKLMRQKWEREDYRYDTIAIATWNINKFYHRRLYDR
ncbi:MAG: hypothetical protein C0467_21905 [Planctomycetaceae bacterium]|nr:hypothetical protein [Planctomycetaceae bacterium]